MKAPKHYKIIIEKDEDGFFVAQVPALPGCVTQAKTYHQLIERVQEAIQLCEEVAAVDADYQLQKQTFAYEPTFIGMEDLAVA